MKKKVFRTALLIALCVSLVLSGCSVRIPPAVTPAAYAETDKTDPTQSEPTEEPGLTEEELQTRVFIRFDSEKKEFNSDDGKRTLFVYGYDLPVITIPERPEAAERINETLRSHRDELIRGKTDDSGEVWGLEPMLQQARENDASHEFPMAVPYSVTRSAEVTRCDAAVISIAFDTYTDMGGAHGMTVRTGLTFDAETGERLTLSALSADELLFREKLLSQLYEQADARKEYLYQEYAQALDSVLSEDTWYLDRTGLVLAAQPYDIAPYAAGIQLFTISYKNLSELLHPRFLPPARSGVQGGIVVTSESELGVPTVPVQEETDLNTKGKGEHILLRAVNKVYDVRVVEAVYEDYSGKFTQGKQYLLASRLDDGMFLRVTAYLPDLIPNLMLSWRLPDGTEQSYLISQSGEDGTILLLDPMTQNLQPGEISQELPFLWDLNSDGSPESIRLVPSTLKAAEEGALELFVSSDKEDTAYQLGVSEETEVWIADPVGSGDYLLGVSCLKDGAWTTRFLRYSGSLTAVSVKDGDRNADAIRGRILNVSESGIEISSDIEFFGKHTVEKYLEPGPDKSLVPSGQAVLRFTDDETMIRTRSDLTVTLSGGQTAKLAAGTRLRFTETDESSYLGFDTVDGLSGRIAIEWNEKAKSWTVDGQKADKVFQF